jgi:uncharacterized protein YecT (DUF1311 family)
MRARILLALVIVVSGMPLAGAYAQTRKPTVQEVALSETAQPNIRTTWTRGSGRRRVVIWDNLLNENFKSLMVALDNQQLAKLRAMQQAWIAYRDTTCNFYMDKIQGSMAISMGAACAARETARRALLLRFFDQI